MLSQEEFREIDYRLMDYESIQFDLAVLKTDYYDETLQNLKEYDVKHTQFIAYSIIDMSHRRLTKDEILAKLYFDLMSCEDDKKEIMMNQLFKNSEPLLRRVFDLGAFGRDEIERRNASSYPVFGDIFPEKQTKVEYNGQQCDVTKDWIYNRYPDGTAERAIIEDDPEKAISLMQPKGVDDLITKSPFDFYDEPNIQRDPTQYYEESTLPSYLGLALHCGSNKCVSTFLQLSNVEDYTTIIDFAIKNGSKQFYALLKKLGAKIQGKFVVAARYFNYSLMLKLEIQGEGEMVWNNVKTVYDYYDDVHDQLINSYVYDLIDHVEFNDVTKWFLCVRGMSMYKGNKYHYFAINHNNPEIATFIRNQGIELFSLSSSSSDDDN